MDATDQPQAIPHPEDWQVQVAHDDTAWLGPALQLDPFHTDLWITDAKHLEPDGELLQVSLTSDERMRAQRLVQESNRNTFILFRGALRGLLARYLGNAPPGSLVFSYGPHGKPELAHPNAIQFNLAHAGDRLAVVVSHQPVGVDIERTERATDLDAVAARFYHPAETATLAGLPPDHRRALFFRWWTAKEATLKAWGLGLGSEKDYPDYSRWTTGSTAHMANASAGRPDRIHAFPAAPEWAGAVVTGHPMKRLTVRDVTGWWPSL